MGSASFETLMNRHGISMRLIKAQSVEGRSERGEEAVDRYRCHMSREGKEIELYVAVPSEEELSASDFLFLLVLDASGCELFKDYQGRQEEFQEMLTSMGGEHDGFDEFWTEYESRRTQSLKLRNFLGSSLYYTLIDRFGFDN